MTDKPIVLVVDDEIRSLEALRRVLAEEFEVLTAPAAGQALEHLKSEWVHAILCDQRMPGMSGVEFLTTVREQWPDPIRMIISGYTDSEDIIAGLNQAGIYRYLTKPWQPDELLATVREAVKLYDLQRENQNVSAEVKLTAPALEKLVGRKKQALKRHYAFERIIHADDSPLAAIGELVKKIARYDISILLTGESGTGKELLARAIHYNSLRADQPFIVENCGALPDPLLESELFGCKKGAFTGAFEDRIGLFEQADGGTIFLDEIGETSPGFQVKLLRVLQEGEIRPLGARHKRKVDVRVIAATNRDLEEDVKANRFRRDLFYRLATFPVHLPPLRERPMDLLPLAEHLVQRTAEAFKKPIRAFAPATLDAMRAYGWPGNVRELHNEIQRMVALCETDVLEPHLLSSGLRRPSRDRAAIVAAPTADGGTLKDRVQSMEEGILREVLVRHRWNISRAAAELGLSRVGLRAKLNRYGLEKFN